MKKWHTGLMTRETPAAWVDVDVAGAKRLELVVGDAGDATSDHADWAEARLLRKEGGQKTIPPVAGVLPRRVN